MVWTWAPLDRVEVGLTLPIAGVTGFGQTPLLDAGAFDPVRIAVAFDAGGLSLGVEVEPGSRGALAASGETDLGPFIFSAELGAGLDSSGPSLELVADAAHRFDVLTSALEVQTIIGEGSGVTLTGSVDVALAPSHRLHGSLRWPALRPIDELRFGLAYEARFD